MPGYALAQALLAAGFTRTSVTTALLARDLTLLEHSGRVDKSA
jgi:hypothetical protein